MRDTLCPRQRPWRRLRAVQCWQLLAGLGGILRDLPERNRCFKGKWGVLQLR